jgi:hypothetical protein
VVHLNRRGWQTAANRDLGVALSGEQSGLYFVPRSGVADVETVRGVELSIQPIQPTGIHATVERLAKSRAAANGRIVPSPHSARLAG